MGSRIHRAGLHCAAGRWERAVRSVLVLVRLRHLLQAQPLCGNGSGSGGTGGSRVHPDVQGTTTGMTGPHIRVAVQAVLVVAFHVPLHTNSTG